MPRSLRRGARKIYLFLVACLRAAEYLKEEKKGGPAHARTRGTCYRRNSNRHEPNRSSHSLFASAAAAAVSDLVTRWGIPIYIYKRGVSERESLGWCEGFFFSKRGLMLFPSCFQVLWGCFTLGCVLWRLNNGCIIYNLMQKIKMCMYN